MIQADDAEPGRSGEELRQDEEPGLGQDRSDEDHQDEPAPPEEDDVADEELVDGQGQQGDGQRGRDAERPVEVEGEIARNDDAAGRDVRDLGPEEGQDESDEKRFNGHRRFLSVPNSGRCRSPRPTKLPSPTTTGSPGAEDEDPVHHVLGRRPFDERKDRSVGTGETPELAQRRAGPADR